MSLSVTQRIEILILLGCGDKTRTRKQVCEIFNTKYSDRRISQSMVSRIENKFCEFGNVTDIPKCGRKRILDDEQNFDILLDIRDNPHKPTRQVAADNDINPNGRLAEKKTLNETCDSCAEFQNSKVVSGVCRLIIDSRTGLNATGILVEYCYLCHINGLEFSK
ncbi:hypothetical protein NQ318_013823 [Aromia moschata]|uniref:Uncharacterized protein n=1 Tax=Aromia moschata TaxID=1265417 RepID=A0AAV8Z9X8_9CUCU|nr:hypothetical protein NQ318_013823 [Aromia moschata]